MSGHRSALGPLRAALLCLIAVFGGAPSHSGRALIEGGGVRISVGETRGYGVMFGLGRHGLLDVSRGRTPEYHAQLRRLGPRMRGARLLIRDHPGGFVMGTIVDVQDVNVLGLPVRIEGRYCHSACTYFLGARDVCVSPDTLFGFHRPERPVGEPPLSEAELRAAIMLAAGHYRGGLRDWWLTRGSRSDRLLHLTGRDLIRFGYRTC
jgi:hypothetical protein